MNDLIPMGKLDPAYAELLKRTGPLTVHDPLVPADICKAIVERPEPAAIGNAVAIEEARRLIGCYPKLPHDPVGYVNGIVSVLAAEPLNVTRQAINNLTKRLKFTPSRADLVEALADVQKARRALRYRAKLHIAERERRETMIREQAQRDAERASMREVLGDAWDDWWKVPTMTRLNNNDHEAFAAGWKAAPDKARFRDAWGTKTGTDQIDAAMA